MTRLNFVKKAAKDYPGHEIKRGEPYFWWKFPYGGKRMSKTRPRRSQLTQSEFFGSMYDAEDSIGDSVEEFRSDKIDFEDLASALESVASDVREAGEQCEEKRSNMPDSLQDGETGQLLETRSERCGDIADELESAASAIRDLEPSDGEDSEGDDPEVSKNEAIGHAEGISWDYE